MSSDTYIDSKIKILSNKLNLGNFDEVISDAIILLKKNKHQIIFNILCLAYQSKGKNKEAEKIMNEALQLNPNNPYFLNNMGITQHKLANFKAAEEYFLKGLKLVPNYINILNNIGNLKIDLDQPYEAIDYYKKSLAINPKVIQTLINISICYQSLGNFDEAKKYLNDLLTIDPRYTVADRLISSMTKYKNKDPHLDKMEKKISELKLNDIQLANLYFSIAKAYEDLKKYEQSFQNYSKGNDILKKKSNFNIETEKKNFENIKKIYSDILKYSKKEKSRKLIFIVGMPRSGTSLIEQILSSHKKVYGGGELVFLKEIVENKFLLNTNNKVIKTLKFPQEIFEEAHDEYITKISQINSSYEVFTDKSPLNFRYIGFIKKIFPNCKIINCNRNSLDICWSNFKNFFGESLPFTNNLYDLANYYKIYNDLIEFWKIKLPNEIYEMDYNQLINNPEKEIKKILNFCDLNWDENCMKHDKNTKTIKTASSSQARQPINKTGLKTFEPFKDYLKEISEILQN